MTWVIEKFLDVNPKTVPVKEKFINWTSSDFKTFFYESHC